MTFLKILVGILVVLFLLSRIRVGGEVEYGETGLLVQARVGLLKFQVLPMKKKKEKKKTKEKPPRKKKEKKTSAGEKQTGKEPESAPQKKKGGPLELVKRYLPLVCEAAGELKRKIRIDKLYLDLTVASGDAAGTAMAYGYANMALGMLWPMIEQNFEVRDPRLHAGVDFTARNAEVYLDAAFSARLGQMVSFGLRFGWKFLRIYMKTRSHAKSQKEAI